MSRAKKDIQEPSFDWNDMKLVLAVHRLGSFNKAAASLNTSQSRISRRLAHLENVLGVRLFERSVDGVTTTDAASKLLPAAEVMEQAAHALTTSIAGADQRVAGLVRVALPETIADYIVIPHLKELRSNHPELCVELLPGQSIVDMNRNEADLALRFTRPSRGDLTTRRIGVVTMSIFAAQKTSRVRKPETEWDWIDWGSAYEHLPAPTWVRRHYPNIRPVLCTTNLPSILAAVRDGLGVGLLPHALAKRVGGLVELDHTHPMLRLPLWIVGHRAHRDVARVQTVKKFLVEACSVLREAG